MFIDIQNTTDNIAVGFHDFAYMVAVLGHIISLYIGFRIGSFIFEK